MKPFESIKAENYYLSEFSGKFDELNFDSETNRKFRAHDRDLRTIFLTLDLIVQRMNVDLEKLFTNYELYIQYRKSNKISDSSLLEIIDINKNKNSYKLDVATLFIYLQIFIDKIPRFFTYLFHNKKIKHKRYHSFYIYVLRNKGGYIDKLKNILKKYAKIIEEIQNIRDKFIIHQSQEILHIESSKNTIILGIKDWEIETTEYTMLSNENISEIILQFKNLIRELNCSICENIEEIPFQIKRI